MKYCERCNKEFDTEQLQCPLCGDDLVSNEDDDDTDEIVATMTILGLL